jgi:hypothetical protein
MGYLVKSLKWVAIMITEELYTQEIPEIIYRIDTSHIRFDSYQHDQ